MTCANRYIATEDKSSLYYAVKDCAMNGPMALVTFHDGSQVITTLAVHYN